MGLSFLSPLFFAGLAALAVPILVHLIHRERKDVVYFPSLMFLSRIPYQAVRRQKIRHWLLFLMRCLALALLALAFARPLLARRDAVAPPSVAPTREVVVLIDRSYSMEYGDRWTKALAAARTAISGLGSGDRATLVAFDGVAAVLAEPTSDKARLFSALDTLKTGAGVTRYDAALKAAQPILVETNRPRREIVLISDFQREGWDGRDPPRLPAGTALQRIDLSEKTTANLAITGVDFRRDLTAERERVAVSARVVNRGATPVASYGVTLALNGRDLESKKVAVAANGAATVEFAPVPIPEGASRGTIRGDDDALRRDNRFHFTLTRGQTLSVLLVEHRNASSSRSLFVTRALGIGSRPSFKVDTRRVSQLSAAELAGRALVIVNDADLPGGDAGRRLVEYVQQGGGLVVALGDQTDARQWPAWASELMAAPAASPIDRLVDRGGTLGYLDRSHPVFEVFSAPRSGDFSAARFYRYRDVQLTPQDQTLARFDDGHAALVERKVGRGRVLLWTSGFDQIWNDLALQPVFLPFLHQLAKHAASYTEERAWLTVGQVVDPAVLFGDAQPSDSSSRTAPVSSLAADVQYVAEAPSMARTRLGARESRRTLELAEQGFYDLRRAGGRGAAQRTIAVNVDVDESDLTPLDGEIFAASVLARTTPGDSLAREAALTPREREQRQSLWWYLLVATALLLGAETLLGNRLSRVARG